MQFEYNFFQCNWMGEKLMPRGCDDRGEGAVASRFLSPPAQLKQQTNRQTTDKCSYSPDRRSTQETNEFAVNRSTSSVLRHIENCSTVQLVVSSVAETNCFRFFVSFFIFAFVTTTIEPSMKKRTWPFTIVQECKFIPPLVRTADHSRQITIATYEICRLVDCEWHYSIKESREK